MGNDVDMCEMAKICSKCVMYVTNVLKYVGSDEDMFETAKT